MMQRNPQDRFVRRKETRLITGVSERRQRELEELGDFPKPYKIGLRMVAHKLSDLNTWRESRPLDSADRLSVGQRNSREAS